MPWMGPGEYPDKLVLCDCRGAVIGYETLVLRLRCVVTQIADQSADVGPVLLLDIGSVV
jgi:hypothetical protein